MIYGYIRVSTDKQDCENQKIGIESKAKEIGVHIDKYIEDDGISGTREPEHRALGELLRDVRPGDVIICSEISRLGRKLFMIMRILEQCMRNKVRVYTVKDGYELGDNIQSKVLAFAFALSAEIERDLISQRTKEALKKRQISGVRLGRPCGSKNKKYKLYARRTYIETQIRHQTPQYKIAEKLGVSRVTLRRFIEKKRN